MKNTSAILVMIVLVIIVAAGAFFAGMKYQQSKSPRLGNFQGLRNGQLQGGQNQGLRPVNGEIIAQDEQSITVKLSDGSSKIVLIGESTSINKSAEGSKNDLIVGENVAVFGTNNSDGSVTAQNIQLNPEFRGAPAGSNN
ncbi:MAG: hypothetical protein ACD_52C00027G0002 [uncultured bacterium]|nr:MAG: hypothetical protein ACD_52C00027G0002 [uncultured bacterium]KKR61680.1 MAG: hypothetical protein UU00_C0009G0002 [Microgenomates group bacterium GW2011_GWC1_40_35]KKS01042.1 MAG: hypothetical protein UU53_C0020G0003 [Candidatus Curtissbacteria bacterium GW2011_GWC2_41_21]OGD92833.1 MAG: hypothetical protein A3E14_01650 [Candidatus Curtissbacteria bacterium RIFCSPHIGHO2_12_FULL_41_13]OGE08675.1 MAG: hypothetical protein A2615_04010 [Candidatus Curtissbacteria bacterium RIFOXYD1_FULL_41_